MDTCGICEAPIGEARLVDPASGDAFHAACVIARTPQDAALALLAAAAIVLATVVVVWAG